MLENFELRLFDRTTSQNRWCSGSIADVKAVNMGSIPERCKNSDAR